MKTTVEIADDLFGKAKEMARKKDTTLRSLVEEGLRRVIEEEGARTPFRFRPVTAGGRGLRPGLREGDWEGIRDRAYEGRGG